MKTQRAEVKVLLTCVRFYLQTTTKSEVTAVLACGVNWTTLLETANKNGVLPILYQSLKAIGENLVPPQVMVQLQTYNRMNGLHNVSQTKELLKMLTQLEKAGIDAIAFKGPILAASVYGNVMLRQFSDLDILVRLEDFWQAKAVLVAQGYQSSTPEACQIVLFNHHLQISLLKSTPETMMFHQKFETSLLHSNPERSIDLHWGIPPRRIWHSAQFERLWDNCAVINLMGQPVKTFCAETTLVIQCMNITKDPWKRSFKQICDVGQIIRAYPDLNWQLALEVASELRSQQLFLIGLSVTRKLLNIPLPQFILEMLGNIQPTEERVFESNGSREDLQLRNNYGVLQVWWWEYIEQLKTLDQLLDVLFITQHYLQLIFKMVLSPNECDRQFLSLPNKLFFLYYILRPVRLLIQYSPWGKSLVIESKP